MVDQANAPQAGEHNHEPTQPKASRPKKARKAKPDPNASPVVGKRDEFIMDTNNSSIVSKRSVEKLYYAGQPEYFRHFVRKFQRRSPLINRGYWLRMKAIEKSVSRFLAEPDGKTKLVINLGCGYDPLPFQFLGIRPAECKDCVFVDVDYPQLMQRKMEMIKGNRPLLDLLPGLTLADPPAAILGSTAQYKALGCNLNDVASLDRALRQLYDLDSDSVAILFVAEVSVAYMERKAADAVLAWASKLKDARFCLLEQHLPDGPDHPFAATMLKHFEKLRTPLHTIGTLEQMRERFVSTGWEGDRIDIRTLWELWSDPTFLSADERRSLDHVEPFDEWEELALFGSHYFLLEARTATTVLPSGFVGTAVQRDVASHDGQIWTSNVLEDAVRYKRRFGAAIAPPISSKGKTLVCHAGGLGAQERLRTVDVLSDSEPMPESRLPDIPVALMCHTLTQIGKGSGTLLAGGRTSPDKPSAACWIIDGQTWKQVENLPNARYRHCAVSVDLPSGETRRSGALIYGGKGSAGALLDDCWFFDTAKGWQEVRIRSSTALEARFGSAMVTETGSGSSGLLVGGMREDGTIINECWSWKLDEIEDQLEIVFSEYTKTALSAIDRFGAQLVPTTEGMILIGGVSSGFMLDRHNEVVNLTTGRSIEMKHSISIRPLLVGFSALASDSGGIGIFGGGATCFSFGTCWSQSCMMSSDASRSDRSVKYVKAASHPDFEAKSIPLRSRNGCAKKKGGRGKRTAVGRKSLENERAFQAVLQQSEPAVFTDMNLRDCRAKWTADYLSSQVGSDRQVVVHQASGPGMDFQTKNFTYQKMEFGKFMELATEGQPVYLRALSSDKPTESPTELAKDFPSLATDFQLPSQLEYVQRNQHSSPLRISGQVNMWLHYDVMANVYCQIRGTKTLRLYAPESVTQLGIAPGASSSSLDVWNPATEQLLRRAGVRTYEAQVEEGDVLFIPPLWLHAARPSPNGHCSVAVNVFFRDERMQAAYAQGRDVYGNRDVAAYERGRTAVQKVAKSFEGLPMQVKEFYLARLAEELMDSGR